MKDIWSNVGSRFVSINARGRKREVFTEDNRRLRLLYCCRCFIRGGCSRRDCLRFRGGDVAAAAASDALRTAVVLVSN